jgi:F-type H+-transporting ATPase subunit delta
VHGLLEGKAAPETVRLAEQAVRAPRGRRLDRVMEEYLLLASTRRDELTARVTVAAPLTEQQYTRLGSALEAHYGKPVTLQVVQDPSVMGGIRIQVGDEVVDGTVLRRLDEARRHVTGG